MIMKRKYIKRAYIEEAYCDKCGSVMESTGEVLCSYPAQYPYRCTNKDCDGRATFWATNLPGTIKYEFEEDMDIRCTTLLP